MPRASIAVLLVGAAALLAAAPALADPCKAIPDRGPMPEYLKAGARFSGPVVYIGDADSICVAATRGRERDPATWVEVRVADFYGPELNAPGGREAKAVMERLAMGKRLACQAQHKSYDRVVARCTLNGVSIGDKMRAAGVREGGNGRSPR